MSKFENVAQVSGKRRQKIAEQGSVALHGRRELNQHRADASGGPQRADSAEEDFGKLARLQAQAVGDAHVRFNREDEPFWRGVDPAFERGGRWEPAERVVDFDGVEALAVVFEE